MLEIAPMVKKLNGVKMEIEDSNSALLSNVTATDDPKTAFHDADYAIMLGGFPRKPGMERKDLLGSNRPIFESAGKALKEFAKEDVKVLVVANPANSNALILQQSSGLPPANVSALTRLDQNRACAYLAKQNAVAADSVEGVIIWGNHSKTQVPDLTIAKISEKPAAELPNSGLNNSLDSFIVTIQNRGAAVIEKRQQSSALSAAVGICDHLRDLHSGSGGKPVSMAVCSDGNPFGIAKGLYYSFPVACLGGGKWRFYTEGLPKAGSQPSWFKERLAISEKELLDERREFSSV